MIYMTKPELRSAQILRLALLAGTAGASLATAMPAFAQASPEETTTEVEEARTNEIIVTARRRAENIQDVPAAITAITADDLEAKQIVTQNDLKYVAPSLGIQGRYGHQGGTYSIRGLAGPTSGNASVGTYFAEVPSPQGLAGFDVSAGTSLYDLESVQILKGPQGTLFGRTSTAGALLVTPRKPNLSRFEGNASVTLGSLGRTEVDLALGGPIIRDILGVRVAFNRNRVDGYTKVIGTNDRLDETNTRSFRVTLEFQPFEWLRNTTIYDDYSANAAPGSFILSAYNPALPSFNLPANTTTFNARCATAVSAGLSPSVASCVAQRLALLAKIKGELATELGRTSQGGDALRSSNSGMEEAYREVSKRQVVVNTTTVDLPSFGGFEWQFKNIFGYQRLRGYTLVSATSNPTSNIILGVGAPGGANFQQSGNHLVPGLGDGFNFYTEEAQLSGSIDTDRLVWVAGYYYQKAPLPTNLEGLSSLNKSLGGVNAVNLGFATSTAFPVDGKATQEALYAQATLGFDGFIDGLKLTAGYRHSKDFTTSTTAAAVLNPATGAFTPSTTLTTSELETSGSGYNFSLDYKLTPSILIYATTRKGYVPGGLNSPVGNSSGLANYALVYGSEKIKDWEIGTKIDFEFGQTLGRLNLAYYRNDYTNIQRTFSGTASTGAVVLYTANVAAAKLSGFEAELFVQPGDRTTVSVNYSYNKTGYTEWLGADPLNLAPAGTILDLSGNPFANAPRHKLSINAGYDVFKSDSIGTISISGQAYVQSREWFSSNSLRFLQAYGEDLKEAISQRSYATFNAKIDWKDVMGYEGLSAGLFVRNLTDKIYTTSGLISLNTFGSATKSYAEPRTYGLNVAYRF